MSKENDPTEKVAAARRRLRESDLPGRDKEAILAWSEAADERSDDAEGETVSLRTNATYTDHLRRIARRLDGDTPLLDADTKTVRDVFASMTNDYAKRTLGAYESAAKAFYRHHTDHAVDVDDLPTTRGDDNAVDVTEILTEEEFFALREAATNARDRAVVDLLGFTGQRVRAIQTLQVGDVDPHRGQTGQYTLNSEAGGLKGADRSMQQRPLLGAKKSVIDLLKDHPTGNDDDFLITCLPTARNGTPGEMLSQTTIRRILSTLADRAGIDTTTTPVNPHAFRHFFATTAYRDYDMGKDTIKKLLGHVEDSRVFETTYRHLDDDAVISDAESALGVADEDDGRTCPPMCPNCHEPLPDGTEVCECGHFVADTEATDDEDLPAGVEKIIEARVEERVNERIDDRLEERVEAKVEELLGAAYHVGKTGEPADGDRVQREAVGALKEITADSSHEGTPVNEHFTDDESDTDD